MMSCADALVTVSPHAMTGILEMIDHPDVSNAGRREFPPTVLINTHESVPLLLELVSQTREVGWQLVDVSVIRDVPKGPPPIGAIVDGRSDAPFVSEIRNLGCPIVKLGHVHGAKDILGTTVRQDLNLTGRMAVEYFANSGFGAVAYVGHTPWGESRSLYLGARKMADRLGLQLHVLRLDSPEFLYSEQAEKEQPNMPHDRRRRRDNRRIVEWLQTLSKPIGLIGYDPEITHRLCFLCNEADLKIPEDVAILSNGDDPAISALTPVQITYINPNYREQAREVILQLQKMIAGARPKGEPVLIAPRSIVEQNSTDRLGISDPRVERALRFIWENLTLPLTVEDIAREIGVPRSTLERLFMKALARSPNAELRRKRLEVSCKMLRQSDSTIDEISKAVGFRSTSYLYQVFRKEMHITPNEYRRSNRVY